MPVSFSKLRITGFKSFAEQTSVEILPGLTGVVGPNGCGKSNIVEAMRWAMGESSARGLRGGEMEDVIFAGTTGRPSRNIAEVVITLSDTQGIAPPPFTDFAELEIQRRIERGAGSAYRINGREARARDVQTLFADLASGSRASAMVSQGRVGALVAAKPDDRRAVLEEAAGITGLHARRHEAELKLRAAEANLGRADDLKTQLDVQLNALKRQARQAGRYRTISGAIRTAEAELLAIQYGRAELEREAAHEAHDEAAAAAAAASQTVATSTTHAAETAAAVPPLRQIEGDTRSALERLRLAEEQLNAEEARARAALDDAKRRLAQLEIDLSHADRMREDAGAAHDRLGVEDAALAEAAAAWPDQQAAAAAAATEAAAHARAAEHDANRATEAAAEAAAHARSAEQAFVQAEHRLRQATGQLTRATDERAAQRARQVDPVALEQATRDHALAQTARAEAHAALDQAETSRAAAAQAQIAARAAHAATESARARLAAEQRALAEVLGVKDNERWPPMIDSLAAPAGLETALGAVLGEELTSALDRNANRYWRELPPLHPEPALPMGALCLAGVVEGPPALRRSLSQIGLVEDEAQAEMAAAAMAPGQVLVSRDGAVWRWDGYTIRAGTPTAAAVRLRQRNRLNDLRKALARAELDAAATLTAQSEADQTARVTVAAEQTARVTRREREQRLDQAHAAATRLRDQAATAASRLAAIEEQYGRFSKITRTPPPRSRSRARRVTRARILPARVPPSRPRAPRWRRPIRVRHKPGRRTRRCNATRPRAPTG